MIIFNIKALGVGIGGVAVGSLLGWATGSFGVGMITCGIVSLLLSIVLSQPYTGYLRLPLVFFIPTHLFAALILMFGIIGQINECKKSPAQKAAESHEESVKDSGEKLIKADMALLDHARFVGDTVAGHRIDTFMRGSMMPQLEPAQNAYLVKYNADSTRILILMKIADVRSLKKEIKTEEVGKALMYFRDEYQYGDREMYLGIISGRKMYLTQNPREMHVSSFMNDENELIVFYDTTAVVKKQIR